MWLRASSARRRPSIPHASQHGDALAAQWGQGVEQTLNLKHTILNEALSRKPEKPLYHYTTQAGLMGIIKDRQIWATHTQYLNDRREFLHAVDLVRREIKRLLGEEN